MCNDLMNNKWKILSNMFLFAILSIFAISCSSPFASKPLTQGVVIFVNGKADVTRADNTTSALKQADVLAKGDIIKTDKLSYVIIQFGDDILTRIQDNTTVEVVRLLENAQTELSLKNGQVVAHVKKISKDANFKIETPTAIAAVRGTSYSMSYYPSRSVLAVKDGKVQLVMKDEKLKEKEHLVETASTYVISSQYNRGINEFESLEIDKLANVPFATKDEIENKKAFASAEKISVQDDKRIADAIIAKGGPLPKSREEVIARNGFMSMVILYSNRTYTGEIISRGAEIRIRTVDGIVVVPFKQVRNIKRVQ